MAREILDRLRRSDPASLAVADRRETLDHRALTAAIEALVSRCGDCSGVRYGLVAHPDVSTWIALLGLLESGATVFVVPPGLERGPGAAVVEACGIQRWHPDDRPCPARADRAAPDGRADIVLFTSGTTGTSKAVAHRWETLCARVHTVPALSSSRWLLGYGLGSYAGLQVALHALLNGAALILGDGEPSAQATLARDLGATHVSGTPTFFRMLLATTPPQVLDTWKPRQITLGGERVDQAVLDRLATVFPGARVTHIYASTEMGICFSVHDRRAGFPVSMLRSDETPTWVDVVDGELVVRSRHRMMGYLAGGSTPAMDGAWRTGDLVRIAGDRVEFVGRTNGAINVGGRKVFPEEVEDLLRSVPGVVDVRVYGKPSALVGELVAADLVLADGVEDQELRQRVTRFANERLAPHQRPRILQVARSVASETSLKKERGRPCKE